MLYGRSIKFYKPLNPHYYGSKEKGSKEEGSKEEGSKEEEGISHISSTKKKTRTAGFFLSRHSNFAHDSSLLR